MGWLSDEIPIYQTRPDQKLKQADVDVDIELRKELKVDATVSGGEEKSK